MLSDVRGVFGARRRRRVNDQVRPKLTPALCAMLEGEAADQVIELGLGEAETLADVGGKYWVQA
jgi:hypothetical protein